MLLDRHACCFTPLCCACITSLHESMGKRGKALVVGLRTRQGWLTARSGRAGCASFFWHSSSRTAASMPRIGGEIGWGLREAAGLGSRAADSAPIVKVNQQIKTTECHTYARKRERDWFLESRTECPLFLDFSFKVHAIQVTARRPARPIRSASWLMTPRSQRTTCTSLANR
jgi:hypothetical protein